MSQPDLARQPGRRALPKQGISVYTVMLLISFIALLIGCTLLYMELNRYGSYPWWNTRSARPSPVSLQLSPPSNSTISSIELA